MPCRHISPAQTSSSGHYRATAAARWPEPPIGPTEDRRRSSLAPAPRPLRRQRFPIWPSAQAARCRTARCGDVSRTETNAGATAAASDPNRPKQRHRPVRDQFIRVDYQRAELLDRILRWWSQLLEGRDRPLSDRFLVATRLHQVDGRTASLFTTPTQLLRSLSAHLNLLILQLLCAALSHRTCIGPRNTDRYSRQLRESGE